MIVKPCPECGNDNAGCGCFPYFLTECRGCGETTFGTSAPEECYKCTPSDSFVPFEEIQA